MGEKNKDVNTQENNAKKSGSYLTGILGAILGGAIATIPWILVYIYGNMMLSILAVLIAAGEFYGYKLLKGKVTKALPAIIMVIAVVIVSIATLVVIPAIMLNNQGIHVSISTIKSLYANQTFSSAIFHDFAMSVVFTILGASVITANIRKQIQNGNDEEIKLDLNNTEELAKIKKDSIEKIKPIFEKFNSFDKEHGVEKAELLAEVNEKPELKTAFNYLKSFGIVKTSKGRFYYSVENEEKQTKPRNQNTNKIVAIIVAVCTVIGIIAMALSGTVKGSKTKQISDGTVSFDISESWTAYTNAYETGWNYYKYINTVPPLDANSISTTEVDYSKYPAYLNVSYYEVDTEKITSIEDVKNSMKEYIDSLESKPDIYEEEISKTKAGYDMLTLKMHFGNDEEHEQPEQLEYLFYLLNGDQMACIDTYSFNMNDDKDIKDNANKIAQTFKWQD